MAYVYETERRPPELVWSDWAERLASQLAQGLDALEARTPDTGWFGGDRPNGADAAVVATIDFLGTVSNLLPLRHVARLQALSTRSRAIPAFDTTRPDA